MNVNKIKIVCGKFLPASLRWWITRTGTKSDAKSQIILKNYCDKNILRQWATEMNINFDDSGSSLSKNDEEFEKFLSEFSLKVWNQFIITATQLLVATFLPKNPSKISKLSFKFIFFLHLSSTFSPLSWTRSLDRFLLFIKFPEPIYLLCLAFLTLKNFFLFAIMTDDEACDVGRKIKIPLFCLES